MSPWPSPSRDRSTTSAPRSARSLSWSLDVETTGGSPATCYLTEVAAARYRGGELLGTYQTFVRPDERIPPFITALTGISDAMVADAPPSGEMLPSFLEFLGGGVIVGHNVRFDLSFLNHALESTGRDRLPNATVDTLALARRLVRDMVPNCKLGTLAASLRLPHQPSHRALTDVLATGDLLHALLERAGSFGIVGLEELLDLPRLVGHPQSAKLPLTNRLPHRPGVYWFTDPPGMCSTWERPPTSTAGCARTSRATPATRSVGCCARWTPSTIGSARDSDRGRARGTADPGMDAPFNQQGKAGRRMPVASPAEPTRIGGVGYGRPKRVPPLPLRGGGEGAPPAPPGPPEPPTGVDPRAARRESDRANGALCRTGHRPSPDPSSTRIAARVRDEAERLRMLLAVAGGSSRSAAPAAWSCDRRRRNRRARRRPAGRSGVAVRRRCEKGDGGGKGGSGTGTDGGLDPAFTDAGTATTTSGSSWPTGCTGTPTGSGCSRWMGPMDSTCGPIGFPDSPNCAAILASPTVSPR